MANKIAENKHDQPDDINRLVDRISARHKAMITDRSQWMNHWQEVADYITPRKNDYVTQHTRGIKRNTSLFDTTAIISNQLLAGALHGMLSNPTTRFFELIMGDPDLDNDDEVRGWLQDVADKMFIVLNNSNFQTEIHEIYIDLGSISTACLFVGEDEEKIVRFAARSMGEIFILENNLGIIDVVHREFGWKTRQMIQEFGRENLPQFILKDTEQNKEWIVIHAVEPVGEDEEKEKGVFKFRSSYVLAESGVLLSKSGYNEFPFAVPRWTKTSGETYGRGPGMEMLPDIKMVNKMMETTLQGAQLAVRPPLMISDDGLIGKVRLTPGGLTIVRAGSKEPIKPMVTDPRIDFGYQAVEDVRRRIREGFFVDQLQLGTGPQMTAEEVRTRSEEKLRLMGPVLGRQNFELLRPVIERVFGIMSRKKMFKPAPEKIQGRNFDVRYSSLVARAQRMSEGQTLMRAVGAMAPIVQIDPKTTDNIDGDKYIRHVMDIYGVPQKLLRPVSEIKKIRDERAEMEERLRQQEEAAKQADIASKVLPGAAQMANAQNQ